MEHSFLEARSGRHSHFGAYLSSSLASIPSYLQTSGDNLAESVRQILASFDSQSDGGAVAGIVEDVPETPLLEGGHALEDGSKSQPVSTGKTAGVPQADRRTP